MLNQLLFLTLFLKAGSGLQDDVIAVLFNRPFTDVAIECINNLGPNGYKYVQVSPIQEHITGTQWWTAYQPISYKIASRLGTEAQFQSMINTCNGAGVSTIVDIVFNHMAVRTSTCTIGTGGSSYCAYTYPTVPFSPNDFHSCNVDISNYADRSNVQNCQLVGLVDLDTNAVYVQQKQADFMNKLISMGVKGFRMDAAKHMAAADMAAVKSKLTNTNIYWIQEFIYDANSPIQPSEYIGNGEVQEFRYAWEIKAAFNGGNMGNLRYIGDNKLSSAQAGVFVTNHDTERQGDTLNYNSGLSYNLAHVFMLAWPYGSPAVHSGYSFTNNDAGPGTWLNQHAWPEIANMVKFRRYTAGQLVSYWAVFGNTISFGRGNKGHVVIQREASASTMTYQSALPTGTYTNLWDGKSVYVTSTGTFTVTMAPYSAVAIYSGKLASTATSMVKFTVNKSTMMGQNIYVVGNTTELASWNTNNAILMSTETYPNWQAYITMNPSTSFQYKFIMKDGSGTVTWESISNRVGTSGTSGSTTTLSSTWNV